MITIRDLELKRTFVGRDFYNMKYVTTADVQIGTGYNKTLITLTDEQTQKAVDFILDLIREGLTVALEIPEPKPPHEPEPETQPDYGAVAYAGEEMPL